MVQRAINLPFRGSGDRNAIITVPSLRRTNILLDETPGSFTWSWAGWDMLPPAGTRIRAKRNPTISNADDPVLCFKDGRSNRLSVILPQQIRDANT